MSSTYLLHFVPDQLWRCSRTRILSCTQLPSCLFFPLFFLFWPLLGSSNGRVKKKGKKEKKRTLRPIFTYINPVRLSGMQYPRNPLTFSSKIPISIHSFILYYTILYILERRCMSISSRPIDLYFIIYVLLFSHSFFFFTKSRRKEGRSSHGLN